MIFTLKKRFKRGTKKLGNYHNLFSNILESFFLYFQERLIHHNRVYIIYSIRFVYVSFVLFLVFVFGLLKTNRISMFLLFFSIKIFRKMESLTIPHWYFRIGRKRHIINKIFLVRLISESNILVR